jgi:peptidoglycan/LPS O-acetylase OafA/YrhL
VSPSTIIDSRFAALVYAGLLYAAVYGVAAWMVREGEPRRLTEHPAGRVGSIDGLRGVLALGVLVHHALCAHVFAAGGKWALLPNTVLTELGKSSVAMFFMITGFLFTLKTLKPIRWATLYRGRVARLLPLYSLSVIAVFLVAFAETGWRLQESASEILSEFVLWLAFVCFGQPNVNRLPNTHLIDAGVNWSLQCEAIFYVVGVPLLRIVSRLTPGRRGVGPIALVLIVALAVQQRRGSEGPVLYLCHFLVGVVVARVYATKGGARLLESWVTRWAGAIATFALVFVVAYASAFAVLLTAVVFASVVGGASCFGLLKTRPAVWLGDISYGVYLLHGIALWIGYRLVAVPMSSSAFMAFSLAIATVVVVLAAVSYLWLEQPIMRRAKRLSPRFPPASNEFDRAVAGS